MTSDTAIRIRGLEKAYGDATKAVDGVDLHVHRGETLALLGPNGAGKTTTVEILEGHRRRDAGDVEVLGEDPATAGREWRSRIGMVLQSASDHAELTVTETVAYFAGCYPNPRDPAEVIDAVGLTGKSKARIRQLSGGQRRRLDVALGIVGRPELIFLDEPTTGFDPEARRQFWAVVQGLKGDGVTIVLTTHYLDEAEALADRVAIISAGRILDVDSPNRVGGRSADRAIVKWMAPEGARAVETGEPSRLLRQLLTEYDGEVPALTVARPSLEDVYLRMIGASS
jgi:ABC-2 type transport system ATP-binding protein